MGQRTTSAAADQPVMTVSTEEANSRHIRPSTALHAPQALTIRIEAPPPPEPVEQASAIADDEDELARLWMVAHDLRAPLHALMAAADILSSDLEVLPAERVRSLAQGIQRRVEWLQSVAAELHQITDAAEEAPAVSAVVAETPLNTPVTHRVPSVSSVEDVLEDVMPVVEPMLRERRQHLRLDVASDAQASMLGAGQQHVCQALVNLIQNASKYGGSEIGIDVQVRRQGNTLRLEVADEGPGLPAGDPMALFTPFQRGSRQRQDGTALSETASGVGLGLAIVRSIVEGYGGSLGAANRPTGGASFWFELPSLPTMQSGAQYSAMAL